MYDKNFESRMRILFRPLETALKGAREVNLCNRLGVHALEDAMSPKG